MDKKIAGLLGAVAGLASLGSAQAAVPATPPSAAASDVQSYADLLTPVPNAVEQLKADNAARLQAPTVQLAQYYHHHDHHHHYRRTERHHHHYRQPRRHHHHHHHHHASNFFGIPGFGGFVVHSDRD